MERENRSQKADFIRLPIEIVSDILSRLPVETVGFCRTLCKQFYNLTNDPQFVDLHLLRSKSQLPRILLGPYPGGSGMRHCWVCLEEGSFKPISPNGRFCTDLFAHASCNGLLCMSRFYGYDIEPVVLYNPITKESSELPNSIFMPRSSEAFRYNVNVGFGYDTVHEKYKVVRLYAAHPDVEHNEVFTAEIITLGESSWRRLVLPSGLWNLSRHVFHNGAFYWLSLFFEQKRRILVFEISNEMFHTIEFPPPPENPILDLDADWSDIIITKFGEFVCIVDTLPRTATEPLQMWKLTGNKTTGYRLSRQTLTALDLTQQAARVLWFSGTLSNKSYLSTGTEVSTGNGGGKKYGVLTLLIQPVNEESSVQVQYGDLVGFHMLLVEPSLVYPSTLIKAKAKAKAKAKKFN